MYFGVKIEPPEDPAVATLDPVVYLQKKFSPIAFCNIPIKSPKVTQDANHFLAIENWDQYVTGKTGAEITEIIREQEPELQSTIRTCVERFTDTVVEALGKVDHEPRAAMGDYVG